ncbi:DUF91 domain-containing protein, partial [bacterium]|nr:DUF91 domain-containing protein [bacterium]
MARDRGKGDWRSLETTTYRDEAHLQELLYREPQLIKIEPPLLVCVKEFGIPDSGAVDLLAIDENAKVTLIECKLDKNPKVKREVVGQVLEYAAFLSRMPADEFIRRFNERADKPLKDTMTENGLDGDEFEEELVVNLQ